MRTAFYTLLTRGIFIAVYFMVALTLVSCSNTGKRGERRSSTHQEEGDRADKSISDEPDLLNESKFYRIKKVVDGDTFWVDDGTEKGKKIRLIGVNTPESRRTGRKDIEPYGKEATEFAKKWLFGQNVRLEYDVDPFDRYGRHLCYAYLQDGTFINAELVRLGYAQVMTIQPNSKHAEEFVRMQRAAREKGVGLWGIESSGETAE